MNEPFPVHGDNDFPEDYPHGEVKSHKDAATAGEETENLPDLVTKITETSEEKDSQLIKLSKNCKENVSTTENRTLVRKHAALSRVLGRDGSEKAETLPKGARETESFETDTEHPISSRTRSQEVKEKITINSISEKTNYFLYTDLPMWI